MNSFGRRWTVHDRDGNPIYLTEERWQHIVGEENHAELAEYEEHLKLSIQRGRRQQEPLNPRKYRYAYPFMDLPEDFNYVVVTVLFGYELDIAGKILPNNYVATAFFKHIRPKGSLR